MRAYGCKVETCFEHFESKFRNANKFAVASGHTMQITIGDIRLLSYRFKVSLLKKPIPLKHFFFIRKAHQLDNTCSILVCIMATLPLWWLQKRGIYTVLLLPPRTDKNHIKGVRCYAGVRLTSTFIHAALAARTRYINRVIQCPWGGKTYINYIIRTVIYVITQNYLFKFYIYFVLNLKFQQDKAYFWNVSNYFLSFRPWVRFQCVYVG